MKAKVVAFFFALSVVLSALLGPYAVPRGAENYVVPSYDLVTDSRGGVHEGCRTETAPDFVQISCPDGYYSLNGLYDDAADREDFPTS